MKVKSMAKLILAGDAGGTKTLLGLFERAAERPRPLTVRAFRSLDEGSFTDIIAAFLKDAQADRTAVTAAAFGVAGPVIDEAADLTNVAWSVDARAVRRAFGFPAVHLLNDLEAMAWAVPVLNASEVHELQKGEPVAGENRGNIAIIAAGTGLGEALLHNMNGRRIPSASEGGHADFAARTEREIALVRDLTKRYGRADVEHVISGRGLVNIHRVAHAAACTAVADLDDPSAPATITTAGLEGRCAGCVETLDMFVEAYGAEAGNLALRSVATGGVFIGGGIAPKILPAIAKGSFMRAFNAKPPLEDLMRKMPVNLILNDEAGLLGAAVFANSI
jgi:glucokinase